MIKGHFTFSLLLIKNHHGGTVLVSMDRFTSYLGIGFFLAANYETFIDTIRNKGRLVQFILTQEFGFSLLSTKSS